MLNAIKSLVNKYIYLPYSYILNVYAFSMDKVSNFTYHFLILFVLTNALTVITGHFKGQKSICKVIKWNEFVRAYHQNIHFDKVPKEINNQVCSVKLLDNLFNFQGLQPLQTHFPDLWHSFRGNMLKDTYAYTPTPALPNW